MRQGALALKAQEIFDKAAARPLIHQENRVYYKIRFTGDISLPPIREAIKKVKGESGEVVKIYPDKKSVKLAIKRSDLEGLQLRLGKIKTLIDNVVESSLSDVAEEKLIPKLLGEPSRLTVSLRLFDASGLGNYQTIEAEIREYLGQRGQLETIYLAENWALYSLEATSSDILHIIEGVGEVDHVEELPPIALVPSSRSTRPRVDARLASVVGSESAKIQKADLPAVCIVDSGVNRDHELLKNFIDGTWDFATNTEMPCADNHGHGSMVAGIAIHGGSIGGGTVPQSKIIMVKAFDKENPIRNLELPQMINDSITRFASQAKSFNLSFMALGPNKDITEALNEEIYRKGVVVVAAAGNIKLEVIMEHLNRGENYPHYIPYHPIYFPGDADNAITVGGYASISSNQFLDSSPSPFTRSGISSKTIKPDVLAEGGNLNVVRQGETVIDFNTTGLGLTTTGRNGPTDLPKDLVGTSFASPAIASLAARVRDKYPAASAFLVKAIILSAASSFLGPSRLLEPPRRGDSDRETTLDGSTRMQPFARSIQGCGHVDPRSALSSTDFRTCFTLQGDFTGADKLAIHKYEFDVANDADSVSIVFVVGKPGWSKGFFSLKIGKSGPRDQTVSEFDQQESIGDPRFIHSTFRRIFRLERGGVGVWDLDVEPHFPDNPGIDSSLKYGCVVAVQSSYAPTIYRDTERWVSEDRRRAEVLLGIGTEASTAPEQLKEQATLAHVS